YQIIRELRNNNLSCEFDLLDRSLKAQMREANRLNAKFALILGEDEFQKNSIVVKNLSTGEQEEVFLDNLLDYLKTKVN
ncbi:MAG: His/Gly/Thr/Pro-type tRNA ligase C-terminal domain-containing protein, partial [Ignavibacteria bacterium]